eukprot:98049-Pleurochrysis_carterae.AAC.1
MGRRRAARASARCALARGARSLSARGNVRATGARGARVCGAQARATVHAASDAADTHGRWQGGMGWARGGRHGRTGRAQHPARGWMGWWPPVPRRAARA